MDATNEHLNGKSEQHYVHSVLRERIVEHVFIGDALRRLWQRGVTNVEVLRSEFDAGGYDLVMSYRDIVRHIQFKVMVAGGKRANVTASLKLMDKPSGCILWVVVTDALDFHTFLWFGSTPGEPLPDLRALKTATHTKANAEGVKLQRPGQRTVPRSAFTPLVGSPTTLRQQGPRRTQHATFTALRSSTALSVALTPAPPTARALRRHHIIDSPHR